MVYYSQTHMYRHHQPAVPTTTAQYHPGTAASMHPWYNGYHHPQGAQIPGPPQPVSYCMQEEQMWHHHSSMYHSAEYQDMMMGMQQQQQQQHLDHHQEHQLPSPPITVSGSDMSSPGGGGNVTPPQTQMRPTPVRSPYEWIKKTSYQQQPTPGK